MGTPGNSPRSCPSCTYSGRKSWPHWLTQCASSMANRARPAPAEASWISRRRARNDSRHERLGRHVQQVELAAVKPRQHAARLAGLERRVVGGGADAGRLQRVDLVLHQRDERRDDDAGAGAHQRRQLVAQRLAAAGGHEHEGVAAGDEVLDDLLLVRPVLVEAEDVAQQGARGGRRGGRRTGGVGGRHGSESSKVDGRRRRSVNPGEMRRGRGSRSPALVKSVPGVGVRRLTSACSGVPGPSPCPRESSHRDCVPMRGIVHVLSAKAIGFLWRSRDPA